MLKGLHMERDIIRGAEALQRERIGSRECRFTDALLDAENRLVLGMQRPSLRNVTP